MTYKFLRCWVDGGVMGRNPSPHGVYWSVVIEQGPWPVTIRRQSREFSTNHDAEWQALKACLEKVVALKWEQPVVIHSDSQYVVKQYNGTQAISVPQHQEVYNACRALAADLPWVALKWVPREQIVQKVGH